MVLQGSLLVTLVQFVDCVSLPPLPDKRGRPPVYPDRLFLKALVIMIVRHLHKVHELLSVLEQPTAEMSALRSLLTLEGSFPSRRTWERRMSAIPDTLPAQIGCLGRYLVDLIEPWASCGRAVAIDKIILRAQGGIWHQKHREQGERPHTSIDPEAHWTKSDWQGWVYGWKLHMVSVVARVWFPLPALLTPANVADSEPAPALLSEVPAEVRFVLGDRYYNTPDLRETCEQADRLLVATHYGRYPHTDDGVEVRRVFHKLRSLSIENFNEHFKGIFDGYGQVPTKDLHTTQRFALGAIFVYQLAVLYRIEHHPELCVGLKAFLKSA